MSETKIEVTPRATRAGRMLALVAALLGWMFDGFEMGLFPLVGKPALRDLLPASSNLENDVGLWFGVMIAVFLVGAATGGVVFGYLGDRLGRVRAMALSVLAYSVFMGLCGVSQNVEQLLFFRFLSSMGMGGEWSLGVALVMEIWPSSSRSMLAGMIGAASNVGFLLIAFIGLGLASVVGSMESGLRSIGLPENWVQALVEHEGWRLMMILGAVPAVLTFFIRLAVPESERWLAAQEKGAPSHWSAKDLLGVLIGACGPLAMIVVWAMPFESVTDSARTAIRVAGTVFGLLLAIVGYIYPVYGFLKRTAVGSQNTAKLRGTLPKMLLAAGLSGVPLLGTWGSLQFAQSWADQLVGAQIQAEQGPNADSTNAKKLAKAYTQIVSAIGAIVGTVLAAMLGDAIGRRLTYSLMCVASFAAVLLLYLGNTAYGAMFLYSVFFGGFCTASFYGWLPLYLPELFSTSVRATGQGFGFNFGRIIAAVGALQTGSLIGRFAQDANILGVTIPKGYPLACSAMSLVYLAGLLLIWFAPETKGQPLPD